MVVAMNTLPPRPLGAAAYADFSRLVALAEAKAKSSSEDWAEFSLARLIADLGSQTPGRSTDFARVFEGASAAARARMTETRLEVPLAAIQGRDLAAGTGSAGGYLVSNPTRFHQPSLPALRDLNIEVITLERDVPGVPVATGPTFAWASSEGAAMSPTDATFALAAVTPVTAVYQANVNRRFLTQGGPAAEALVRETILNGAGRTMLAGVLGGSGSSGEPTGLTAISGTISQSGTSLAWLGLQSMIRQVADTGAADADCAFVGTPTVRELLAKRERASGSGIAWADGKIDGHPAYVSADCPSASLLYGPWNQIKVFVWGGVSVEIMAGRFSVNGAMTIRCLIDMAVVIPRPGCFAKSTSIT